MVADEGLVNRETACEWADQLACERRELLGQLDRLNEERILMRPTFQRPLDVGWCHTRVLKMSKRVNLRQGHSAPFVLPVGIDWYLGSVLSYDGTRIPLERNWDGIAIAVDAKRVPTTYPTW